MTRVLVLHHAACRGEVQKIAEACCGFFFFRRVPEEFHAILIAFAISDDGADPNWFSRIGRRELHKNFVALFQFHSGKNQQTTFADVAAATVYNQGLLAVHNQAQRQIQPESLPASLYCLVVCQVTSVVNCHDRIIEPLGYRWKLQKCMVWNCSNVQPLDHYCWAQSFDLRRLRPWFWLCLLPIP